MPSNRFRNLFDVHTLKTTNIETVRCYYVFIHLQTVASSSDESSGGEESGAETGDEPEDEDEGEDKEGTSFLISGKSVEEV